jgi:hypothetical protein
MLLMVLSDIDSLGFPSIQLSGSSSLPRAWQLNPAPFRWPVEIRTYMCNFANNHTIILVKLTLSEQSESPRIDTFARFCRVAARHAGPAPAFRLSESAVLRYI